MEKTITKTFTTQQTKDISYEEIGDFVVVSSCYEGKREILHKSKVDTTSFESLEESINQDNGLSFIDQNGDLLADDYAIEIMREGDFSGLCYFVDDFEQLWTFDMDRKPIRRGISICSHVVEETIKEHKLDINKCKSLVKKIIKKGGKFDFGISIDFKIDLVSGEVLEIHDIDGSLEYLPTEKEWEKFVTISMIDYKQHLINTSGTFIRDESLYGFAEFMDGHIEDCFMKYFITGKIS